MLSSDPNSAVLEWIDSLRNAIQMEVSFIPFHESREWTFNEKKGEIVRKEGGFFTIIGISYQPNMLEDVVIDLPLINQPEIGLLGFIVVENKGGFEILFQAKAEPGNARTMQLAPSVQATKSNYLQKHGGRSQPFIEFFLDKDKTVVHQSLQTEQGWRFFKKRNKNIIIKAKRKYPVTDTFHWVHSARIPALVRENDLLNSDARSVLSCLLLDQGGTIFSLYGSDLAKALLLSSTTMPASTSDSLSWYKKMAKDMSFTASKKSLHTLVNWEIGSDRIARTDGKMFEIKHITVDTSCREVNHWDQPIISTVKPEKVTLIGKYSLEGIRFLVKCESEPGLYRGTGVTATFLDNEIGDFSQRDEAMKHFFDTQSDHIAHQFSVENSEEGGRFYRDTNIHEIRIYKTTVSEYPLPEYYRWVTLQEINQLLGKGNILTNELRAVLCALWGLLE